MFQTSCQVSSVHRSHSFWAEWAPVLQTVPVLLADRPDVNVDRESGLIFRANDDAYASNNSGYGEVSVVFWSETSIHPREAVAVPAATASPLLAAKLRTSPGTLGVLQLSHRGQPLSSEALLQFNDE